MYDTYVKRLEDFYKSLSPSEIMFMYFLARDPTTPLVRTNFAKYRQNKTDYYITQGTSRNFYYLYKESHIRYLLSSYKLDPSRPMILYDVKIEKRHPDGNINHGDHIDFGVIRKRPSDIVIMTHYTRYSIDVDAHTFHRYTENCNFTLRDSKFATFQDQKCENIDGPTRQSIKDIYKESCDQHIIHKLITTMLRPPKTKTTIIGGVYKDIGIYSREFLPFLKAVFFDHIQSFVDEICLIHDTTNPNSNIIIFLDIEYTRRIMIMNQARAMKACYSHTMLEKGLPINKQEQRCYDRFVSISQVVAQLI